MKTRVSERGENAAGPQPRQDMIENGDLQLLRERSPGKTADD
jgi:hypothetical protein